MKKSRLNLGVSPGASWEKKELCEVYELGMGKTLKRVDWDQTDIQRGGE